MARGLLAAALAVTLTGCGGTRTVVRTVTRSATQPQSVVYVGHVVSMTRVGGEYLVHFDPQFDLLGVTANVAAAQDMHTTCAPLKCEAVPNDVYSVDESHRVYTFRMPVATTGTVLTRQSMSFGGTRVDAKTLASLVAGGKPVQLFEPLESGVRITVRIDTITTFAQQYRP